MADIQKISSTFSIDLKPIGTLQERDHTRLVDCLMQEIGPQAAALLAEPVTNRDGSRTDWYTRLQGRPVQLSKLPEDEAVELRDRLSRIEAEIDALCARYSASSNADDRHLSQALLHCLSVPADSYIYAVGGEPVLTAWGYALASRQGYRGGLAKIAPLKAAAAPEGAGTRYVPTSTEPQPDAKDDEKPRAGCLPALLWLLFALLVAAILFLLLRACAFGVTLPWFNGGFCRAPIATSAIGELQQEMADLENRLLARRDECAATGLAFTHPGDIPQIAASGSPQSEIERRLEERQAQAGSLQISLIWEGLSDLDLAVNCGPERINFGRKNACGGFLDIDSNGGNSRTPHPVENIYWNAEADVPDGKLPIDVTLYSLNGQQQTEVPYTLRIQRKNGQEILSERILQGSIAANDAGRSIAVGDANQ